MFTLLLSIACTQLCSALVRNGISRTEYTAATWTSSSALTRERHLGTGAGLRSFPKVIHQTWKDDKLPSAFQNWSKSWQECLPGWEYRLYNDEDNRNFIKKHFPEFLKTYDGYDMNIKRVDAVRYAYLAVDGGLYVDLDIECLQDPYSMFSHDENGLWGNTDLTLACESDLHHPCVNSGQISNAFMYAGTQAGKDFFKGLMQRLPEEGKKNFHVLWATGPQFLTKAYRELVTANMNSSTLGFEKVQDFHTRPYSIKRLSKAPVTVTMVDDSLVFDVAWDDTQGRLACLNRTRCKERAPHAMSVSHWAASWQPQLSTLEVEKAHTVEHAMDECFTPCGGKSGYCDWCGRGNACCRYQFVYINKDPKECERAVHFSKPYNHVCVALHPEEGFEYAPPKRAGFLQSATLQRHEMCSCLNDGLYHFKEPTQACRTTLNQHLQNELKENGGTFRDGVRKLQEMHERLRC